YGPGVVLFERVCGRVPFEGASSSSTALARLHSDPQRPRLVRPGIPRELEAITMRLLARSPDDRYATAGEARAALLGAGGRAARRPARSPADRYAPAGEARAALLGAGADDGPTTGDTTVVESGRAGADARSVATAGATGHLPPPPMAPPTPLGTSAVP